MDFEAEGLLEGLEGDARDARERLLQDLVDDGVSLEEIHEACREDRLALLPVDRVLATDTPYTARDLADRTGVDLDALRAARGAFGLPIADDDERVYGDADLEVAANLKAVLDAGISLDNVVEMNRVIGRAVHQVAAASRAMVGDTVFRPGMTEYDLAKGSAAAARELAPRMGRTLEYVYGRHLRGLLRSEVVSATDIAAGRRGAREITVAFADLVGFTRIGEQVEAEQLGALSGRLEALASQHVETPVTLVKVVGDAVMLVSPRGPDPLIDCALSLVAAADELGDDFPQLRVGVSCGAALERAGDWYGSPVNQASRITDIAWPGSVLVAESVVEHADGWSWSFAGDRKLKGVGSMKLFRARRPAPE
jgi:adenylate cyclase